MSARRRRRVCSWKRLWRRPRGTRSWRRRERCLTDWLSMHALSSSSPVRWTGRWRKRERTRRWQSWKSWKRCGPPAWLESKGRPRCSPACGSEARGEPCNDWPMVSSEAGDDNGRRRVRESGVFMAISTLATMSDGYGETLERCRMQQELWESSRCRMQQELWESGRVGKQSTGPLWRGAFDPALCACTRVRACAYLFAVLVFVRGHVRAWMCVRMHVCARCSCGRSTTWPR